MENLKLPKHIGIIMDANRRWARERGLDIKSGHKEGASTMILFSIAGFALPALTSDKFS